LLWTASGPTPIPAKGTVSSGLVGLSGIYHS
jgi:hypothetical protein